MRESRKVESQKRSNLGKVAIRKGGIFRTFSLWILLFSETAYELARLLCSETAEELPIYIVKLQMSYLSIS